MIPSPDYSVDPHDVSNQARARPVFNGGYPVGFQDVSTQRYYYFKISENYFLLTIHD
jgi:hypothetical protein